MKDLLIGVFFLAAACSFTFFFTEGTKQEMYSDYCATTSVDQWSKCKAEKNGADILSLAISSQMRREGLAVSVPE